MTVTSTYAAIKRITGSGWSNPLTHGAYLEDSSYLEVWADGTQLTLGADYTVSGVADTAGYEVTILTPGDWDPTTWVLMVRNPMDQPTDLSAGGTLGTIYEDALDVMARRLKTLAADVGRSVKRRADYSDVPEFTAATYTENAVPKFNASGDLIDGPTVAEIEAAETNATAAAALAAVGRI